MKVRADLLAALAVAAFMEAPHAASGQPAPWQNDGPARTDSDRSNDGEPGSGPRAGSAPENATEHQPPAAKPEPGAPVRGSMWDTPIDTGVPVVSKRAPDRGPRGVGVAIRAIALRLQNKSVTAMAPGVTVRHDAHKPAQIALGAGVYAPRNGLGPEVPAPASATGHALVTADHNHAAHHVVALSAGGPGINGTAMIRPGAGAGAIGGPAKPAAGVISGANVRMRHP
jgi:hypothetical protein